jgi:hypothetical protein
VDPLEAAQYKLLKQKYGASKDSTAGFRALQQLGPLESLAENTTFHPFAYTVVVRKNVPLMIVMFVSSRKETGAYAREAEELAEAEVAGAGEPAAKAGVLAEVKGLVGVNEEPLDADELAEAG